MRTPRLPGSGGASRGAIRPSSADEPIKVSASATRAAGADSTRTSSPATLGPATKENARLPFRSELPSTKRSRGTIETNSEASETLKSTLRAPSANPTTSSWTNVSPPTA